MRTTWLACFNPLYGPLLPKADFWKVETAMIVNFLFGLIASLWMICALLHKYYSKSKLPRRPNVSNIDKILLTMAFFNFLASTIEVWGRWRRMTRPPDPNRSPLRHCTSYNVFSTSIDYVLSQAAVTCFQISFNWEAVLMVQIFLVVRGGSSCHLNFRRSALVVFMLAVLRLVNLITSPSRYNKRFYDNSLMLLVMLFNVSIIIYLFRSSNSRFVRVPKRTLAFPFLYLVFVTPRLLCFWVSVSTKSDVHRHQILKVIADILSYSYIFLSSLAFGLSHQCIYFMKRRSPRDSERKTITWMESQGQIKYNKNEIVGMGAIGIVYLGMYRGTKVAIKEISLTKFTDGSITASIQQAFEKEALTLSRLAHPNIVYFMGAYMEDGYGYIVCEHCSCGSLRDLLDYFRREHDRAIDWSWKYRIALGAARGLLYLHETVQPSIIHRDLKSPNVLITDSFTAKIGDFGTAKLFEAAFSLKNEIDSIMTTAKGTARWAAPEIVKNIGETTKRVNYTKAVDIYSFGIMLWELCTYQVPFEDLRFNYQVETAVASGGRPEIPVDENLSPQYLRLMKKCWDQVPENRPTALEIVSTLERILDNYPGNLSTTTEFPPDINKYQKRHARRFLSAPTITRNISSIDSNYSVYKSTAV